MNHLPLRDLDRLVGDPSPAFQKLLNHPCPDDYYDSVVPSSEAYKRINIPILTITGHYDGNQPGAMTYYRNHLKYGSSQATANHFLIIGPWDHAGTRTPSREFGGLKFGEACILDLNGLHKEWYDWTMKNGPQPEFLKKRVAYYVVGPGVECWKYADSLDSVTSERRVLYLHSAAGPMMSFIQVRLGHQGRPKKNRIIMFMILSIPDRASLSKRFSTAISTTKATCLAYSATVPTTLLTSDMRLTSSATAWFIIVSHLPGRRKSAVM